MPVDALQQQGILGLLSAYLFGVLTSLTPCVYPLIPITLAHFGARDAESRLKAFMLAFTFVSGIAFTYTTVGMITARTGMLFGSFLGNPYLIGALSLFLISMALYTLDLFTLPWLSRLQGKASGVGGKGYFGAFAMGAVSGVVAAPCAGPALATILVFAAASQDWTWAALLLLSYSFGLGTIFLILGTFANELKRLPRSGNWLNGVKLIIAIGIFVVVLFLSAPHLDLPDLQGLAQLLPMGLTGLALCYLAVKKGRAVFKLLGSTLLAFTLFYALGLHRPTPPITSASTQENSDTKWHHSLESALPLAKERKVITMVDLWAEWCVACLELEKKTFVAPQVSKLLDGFVTAKIDMTDMTEENEKLAERYNVPGLPCVLFLDTEGNEIPGTRVTGFLTPELFAEHLEQIQTKNTL